MVSNPYFQRKLQETFREESEDIVSGIRSHLRELVNEVEEKQRLKLWEEILKNLHKLKGASQAAQNRNIETLSHFLEDQVLNVRNIREGIKRPVLEAFFDNFDKVLDLVEKTKVAFDDIQPIVTEVISYDLSRNKLPAKFIAGEMGTRDDFEIKTVKVSGQKIDSFIASSEMLITIKNKYHQMNHNMDLLEAHVQKLARIWKKNMKNLRELPGGTFIQELDENLLSLEQMVKEHYQTMEKGLHDSSFILDNLVDKTKEMIMLPFSVISRGLRDMAKNITESRDKKVSFEVHGDNVRFDKRILAVINEILVHLLSNAIVHGIETPGERKAKGKNDTGKIILNIKEFETNMVELEFKDDGIGLDLEKIVEQGLRAGIISPNQAHGMGPKEIINLIFVDEMSTHEEVDQISGRGLGMAIILEKVHEIGGKLKVATLAGKSTTFKIFLPLVLSSIRGVFIETAQKRFMLPSRSLKGILTLHSEDVMRVENCNSILYQDQNVLLLKLEDFLEISNTAELSSADEDRELTVAVLFNKNRLVAFEIDRVLDEQEVVIKGLGPLIKKIPYIFGVTILADGIVVPVLNVRDMLEKVKSPKNKSEIKNGKWP